MSTTRSTRSHRELADVSQQEQDPVEPEDESSSKPESSPKSKRNTTTTRSYNTTTTPNNHNNQEGQEEQDELAQKQKQKQEQSPEEEHNETKEESSPTTTTTASEPQKDDGVDSNSSSSPSSSSSSSIQPEVKMESSSSLKKQEKSSLETPVIANATSEDSNNKNEKHKIEQENNKAEKQQEEKEQDDEEEQEEVEDVVVSRDPIWEPNDMDVLSGRGASVNAHGGNKKFRALCFARKPEFEAGNHAAKRRIATEIVQGTMAAAANHGGCRFLKRTNDKGPWYEMSMEHAILKACQVMRDYKRPDRLAIREMMAQNGQARKRTRQQESTPLLLMDTPIPTGPLEPIIENPFGVHDHDILSGRGAFVNGHVGNQRLRKLAMERKLQFDSGNYTEKRALATEIVSIIKALDPPGRFLKRVETKKNKKKQQQPKGEGATQGANTTASGSGSGISNSATSNMMMMMMELDLPTKGLDGTWEELNDEKAIHKACQVMRDIDRPDRKDREERRAKKKQKSYEPVRTTTTATASTSVDGTLVAEKGPAVRKQETIKTESIMEDDDGTTTAAVGVGEMVVEQNPSADSGDNNKDIMAVDGEKALLLTCNTLAVEEAVAATEEALDKALDAADEISTTTKTRRAAAAAAAAAAAVAAAVEVVDKLKDVNPVEI